jgi:hypothetical protein
MSRNVDLDAYLAAHAEDIHEPGTFELGGHTFTCVEPIPVTAALDLARAGGLDGNPFACDRFFRTILPDDQHDAFDAALRTANIDMADGGDTEGRGLTALTAQVLRALIQRPTSPPSDSASPSPESGTTSSGDVSDTASIDPSDSPSDDSGPSPTP